MFEDAIPKRKLGMLWPLAIAANGPYEFYRVAPKGVMLVGKGVGLSEFSVTDVERVFGPADEIADALAQRGIDLIMQSGVPLPILIGVEAHDRLLDRLAKRTGKPATSSVAGVARAAAHLGVKNIAVANKWTSAMNKVLAEFFAREGVQVAGAATEVMGPAQFNKMSSNKNMDLAYKLGMQATQQFPEADGLYIGGGSWLVQPMITTLEQEFGKPVICNLNAMIWNTLHIVDFWKPMQGQGRLLASD